MADWMVGLAKTTAHESWAGQERRSGEFVHPLAEIESLRREIERLQVLASHERGVLDAILHHSPHGIIISDASGKLVLQNRAAETIWAGSATASDVAGWGQYRAFHPDGRPYEPGDWSMARCLSRGEIVAAEEVRVQRFDGSYGVLLCSTSPISSAIEAKR